MFIDYCSIMKHEVGAHFAIKERFGSAATSLLVADREAAEQWRRALEQPQPLVALETRTLHSPAAST